MEYIKNAMKLTKVESCVIFTTYRQMGTMYISCIAILALLHYWFSLFYWDIVKWLYIWNQIVGYSVPEYFGTFSCCVIVQVLLSIHLWLSVCNPIVMVYWQFDLKFSVKHIILLTTTEFLQISSYTIILLLILENWANIMIWSWMLIYNCMFLVDCGLLKRYVFIGQKAIY